MTRRSLTTPSPVDSEPLGGRPSPRPAPLGHQVSAAKPSPAQSPQTLTLLASEGCPYFRAFAQTLPCDHTSPHLPFPLLPVSGRNPALGAHAGAMTLNHSLASPAQRPAPTHNGSGRA